MSSKLKRKVTVENTKENPDQPRRPSVFERLGPGALSSPQSQERHGRIDHNEKCLNWLRSGNCTYGSRCRFTHEVYPSSSSKRSSQKAEKDVSEKDLRHKVRKQKDEPKESRTSSLSPQRKGKARSSSRSRKGEHEGKIKSTVVVTRPRSPAPLEAGEEKKKKPDGSWEEDSDDWPMDAAQLDYKEELTLERKRQQLQRELELELQKERLMNNENVTITKTVSFSESSSTTSSSDSGSVSSSSDSSSSSSDDDSDESSSSSSSTSSSASRTSKKKYKKSLSKKESSSLAKRSDTSSRKKPLDDYDKIKSSRNAKAAAAAASSSRSRLLSPVSPETSKRKNKDYRTSLSPASSPPRHRAAVDSKGNSRTMRKGPRTPSPLPSRKDKPWGQRSSTDSRAGDSKRSKGGKRHKKKKDSGRNDNRKYSDNIPVPPRLSSPNRTAIQSSSGKKSLGKDDKLRHKHKDRSPLLAPKYVSAASSPGNRHLLESDRHHSRKRSKSNQRGKKSDDNLPHSYKLDHRERSSKYSKLSPVKDGRQPSLSPHRDKHDSDSFSRRVYSVSGDKVDKRKGSLSPGRYDGKDHRKKDSASRKDARDISPRSHDSRRDSRYQDSDAHHGYNKKVEPKVKRLLSPDHKKSRSDDKKDHGHKDRGMDHDPWMSDQKKSSSSRSHLDDPLPSSSSLLSSRNDRQRDRKKGKDRDPPLLRDDKDRDRGRLSSPPPPPPPPIRKGQEMHPHHVIRDDPPITVPRGRLYEADLPTDDRDYSFVFPPHREPSYLDERALPPDFDPEILHHHIPSLYPPPPTEAADYPPSVFADPLYRRDIPPLKEPAHIERITGYVPREISPLDPRDPVVLPREIRDEDYLDMTLDERRAFDERWGRTRPLRDDWDPFAGTLPPPGLPPHVGLDEDRYGMPRRRRASPDWHLHRGEERDLPIRDRRSRSPQHRRSDDPPPRPWRDDRSGDRHASRASDSRNDNQQKQDDRKSRSYRRDRRDQNKKSDEPLSNNQKPKDGPKERSGVKRPHSPSPGRKDSKKRKEETTPSTEASSVTASVPAPTTSTATADKRKSSSSSKSEARNQTDVSSSEVQKHKEEISLSTSSLSHIVGKGSFYLMQLMESSSGSSSKKFKDDAKTETKTSSSRKTVKTSDGAHAKSDNTSSKSAEKKDSQDKKDGKSLPKPDSDEKKKHSNDDKSQVDDDFSDWSDGDDDLLSRDLNEMEANLEKNSQGRSDDTKKEKKSTSDAQPSTESKENKENISKKKRDASKDSRSRAKEIRSESRSRTGSKERSQPQTPAETAETIKNDAQSLKDNDLPEPYVIKDEAVGEPDDFVTTESVDYDPISDDELEAMIEEPGDSTLRSEEGEKTKIVDALDVDWSVLMNETKPDFAPGNAKKRFKTAHVLSRIGFSQVLAGADLSEEIIKFCQKQLDEENDEEESSPKKFQMEHQVAGFHTTLSERKKERENLFNWVGPARRALCARQDLYIRKLLCRPTHKLIFPNTCIQQHGNVDSKNQKEKSLENQAAVVINTAC